MRNFTKLSVLAASLMLAGNALAVDPAPSSGSVDVTGYVPLICTVDVDGILDFGHEPSPDNADVVLSEDATFQCNDKNGAVISMTSANCGLQNGDHLIDYSFWLVVSGFDDGNTAMPIGPNPFAGSGVVQENTLEGVLTGEGCNENSISALMTPAKDEMLAMGAVTGVISAGLAEQIKFAGTYTDTLTVTIAAKGSDPK